MELMEYDGDSFFIELTSALPWLRNCEMIRTLIFETSGSLYELGAKSFQSPSVPIDKSYIHSGPFAKKVFKEGRVFMNMPAV